MEPMTRFLFGPSGPRLARLARDPVRPIEGPPTPPPPEAPHAAYFSRVATSRPMPEEAARWDGIVEDDDGYEMCREMWPR